MLSVCQDGGLIKQLREERDETILELNRTVNELAEIEHQIQEANRSVLHTIFYQVKGTIDVITRDNSFKGTVDVITRDYSFKGTVDVITRDHSFKGTIDVLQGTIRLNNCRRNYKGQFI